MKALALLRQARESTKQGRFARVAIPIVDPQLAREKARTGDLDGAVDMARSVFEEDLETGEMFWVWLAATVLVESLLAGAPTVICRKHRPPSTDWRRHPSARNIYSGTMAHASLRLPADSGLALRGVGPST